MAASFLSSAAVLLGATASILAQQQGTPAAGEPQEPVTSGAALPQAGEEERPVRFTLTTRTTMGFNSDFEDAPGDLSVARIFGELGVAIPADERGQVVISLDYEFSQYDFNDATGFIAGVESPFEDVHRAFVTARYVRQQTRRFVWYVGGLAGVGFEEGADVGNSVEGGGFGGVRFYFSERFSLGAGLVVVTQLEDDPLIFPTALFEWEFAPGWTLGSGGRPGVTLGYAPSDELRLALSAFYESRDFRLDEDGPLPDGVARERQIPVSLGVEYSPNPRFTLGAAAGVNFARNYELRNSDGDKVAEVDGDPAPFAGLSLVFRF